jgi:hypothetical protein
MMFALIACGGGGGGHTDAAVSDTAATDGAPDAAEHVQLAASGTQMVIAGSDLGLQITPADLAADTDVIEIHQEFYGVPWDAFLTATAPPAAWVAKLDSIASSAHATGKPIFLSISMLNGGRDHLAARTVIDGSGKVQSEDNWSARCYDFATASDGAAYKQAYLRYAAYMTQKFAPRWLNTAIEVNLFFEHCPAASAGLVDVANATYVQAKATDPSLVVFPSIQIDHLYGYDEATCPSGDHAACFDQHYAQIAPLSRDRFAISTYPIPLGGQTVASLPPDWFTRGAARAHERILVAETGMDSTAMIAKPRDAACFTVLSETEADEGAYLSRLLADAQANHFDLVNWWSDRDLVVAPLMTACPCTFDATWCAVLDAFRGPPTTTGPDTQLLGELSLKVFGTMGLRSYDGTPKAFYATWDAARATH